MPSGQPTTTTVLLGIQAFAAALKMALNFHETNATTIIVQALWPSKIANPVRVQV